MTERLNKLITVILTTYLMFSVGLLYWVIIYSGSSDGDTLEHAHSAWLIYSGKIPYKDFFQHHNPLLWYIGAPLVGAYEYSLRAIDAVNILTASVMVLTLWYIWRLHKDFLSNTFGGIVAAAFCIFPHDSLYNKDFKPDNFMNACLIMGIYYLFCYLRNKKIAPLVMSFLLFFFAFMFTQKTILMLAVIGGLILYLLQQEKMRWKDVLTSMILPTLIYILFLSWMWYEDVLTLYFKANFELNSYIPAVFYTRRFISPSSEMYVPLVLSLYALGKMAYGSQIYLKVICILFIAEFLIRFYYFTPFVYYFAFMHAISSILSGAAAAEIVRKKQWMKWFFVTYFTFMGGNYAHTYSQRITVGDSYKYGAAGFVLENTTPCDYVLNGYRIGYNLFHKNVDYIWNLQGQIDVIASTIGIRPLVDLETLIRKHRPKIIYGKNYYDTYREYRGDIGVYPIHWISEHLLNEMYEPLNRDDLYILKPEYQSYDCRYNPRTKTYEYQDKH